MSQSTLNTADQSTIVYGSGRKPDASIPRPGLDLRRGRVAVVVTDPQIDFLSPQGVSWSVVGQNVTENNTVENIGKLFAVSKESDVPLFISPHYYYPHDHKWRFEGALERLMHEIQMFDRPSALDLTGFEGSGADWLEQFKPFINDGETVVTSPHKIYGPESAVKAIQTAKGSRSSYGKMEERGGWQTTVTPELEAFLADLDMFYLGTANAEGQPYIQYRGGAPGFLKVIDEKTLGFADFGGNQQYISLGNLAENPKAFIFLMDYVHSRRIKLWGEAKVVEGDAELERKLSDPEYPGKVERVILFEVEAWDINCPQHIHKRFPQREVAPVIKKLQQRTNELETELATVLQKKMHPTPAGDSSKVLGSVK